MITVTDEFLAAADIEANTPITVGSHRLKEYWCQEKLDFCRCENTEANQELLKMFTIQVGDEVMVINPPNREGYPFLPDLEERMGTVFEIQTTTPIANSPLDYPLYHVRFRFPIRVGVIPEGQCAYGYQPVEWKDVYEWCFTPDQISKLNGPLAYNGPNQ